MFYKQSIHDIEMVILCLDGGILDLNRLRYNYFNRICKQYGQAISKQEFALSLGNYQSMYHHSPVQNMISNDKLNDLIEKDLYEYAKLKQNVKKDGVDELLQFFKQKKIKVAIISTHKTKRAIQYLQLSQIYQYVDFVIGGDSQNAPLPDPAILHTVCKQMAIQEEKTLVVANFLNLVDAASQSFMNIVYMQDLMEANSNIEACVYKTVKNNLEMINVFLFAKYDTIEMYSPVLGMSKEMDVHTLEKTYHRLLEEYHDDPKLIELVEKAYHFFMMEITDNTRYIEKQEPIHTFASFEEEDDNNQDILHIEVEDKKDIENKEEVVVGTDHDNTTLEDTLVFNNKDLTSPSFKKEALNINALMDQINGDSQGEVSTEIHKPIASNKDSDTDKKVYHFYKILDFMYTILVSLITTFVSLMVYVITKDYIESKGIISETIKSIIDFYIMIVRTCYAYFFDGLHALLNFLPNYHDIVNGNSVLSPLAIESIMFTIFNIIIFYCVKKIYYRIRKERKVDD